MKNSDKQKYVGKDVIILDGSSKQALPMIKGFHNLGCVVSVLCGSKLDVGYVCKYTDKKILANIDHSDAEKTYQVVEKIIQGGDFDLVVPVVDFYAVMLAKNKYKLTKYATIYVNDWEIFNHASDKLKTMKVCMENDIPCPKTALIDSFEEFNDAEFSYPLIVKPRSSWGAKGFHVAQNKSELKNWYKVVSNAYGPTLIQEYVPQNGKQYQVELIMDNHGSCKMFIMMEKVRQYPVDGGSSTLNITMHDEHIKNECIRLMKVLHWNGYASFDLIQDPRDGSVKIMEINPRINSTVKICFACGYDVAKLILEQIYDENVEPCGDYPDGVCLRFFHKDILWLIKSKNRFKSKPSWFMFKHNYDMVFEWDDIKPSLVFSIANLIRLFSYKEHE